MRRPDEQRKTDELKGLGVRWLIIVVAGAVTLTFRPTVPLVTSVVLLAASNVIALALCRNLERYQNVGRRFASGLRILDICAVTALSMFGPPAFDGLWILAFPVLIAEAMVGRSIRSLAIATGVALLSPTVALATGHSQLAHFLVTVGSLAAGAMVAWVLSGYRGREETLSFRETRLASILDCASTLATSTDLRSMILHTLQACVTETRSLGGYVMLVDENNPGCLVTEAAYSPDGAFEFPQELAIGTGVTGYAVKMGQPLAVHGQDSDQFDMEGIQVSAQSAVSVPLVTRNYLSSGQAAMEQVLGAVTLLSNRKSDLAPQEDIRLVQSLASLVAVAVANNRMEEKQRSTFLKTLESLAKSLEARDTYTRGHSQRVCDVSLMIGSKLGFSPEALEELRVGTILHDIGKIGVPDSILNKPERLSNDEFTVMKTHPVIGYEICKPLGLSEGILMIIRNHHEKLDGSGYPDGLKGGELPLSLRVVCVADAFDAMSSRRPYRNVMNMKKVLAEFSRGAGSQFDSVIVETLRELLDTQELRECYRDQWSLDDFKAA